MDTTGTDASLLQAATWGQRAIRNLRLMQELPNEAAHFETCAVETAIMAAHCYHREQLGCDWCGFTLGLDPVELSDGTACCFECSQHIRDCQGCKRPTHQRDLDGLPTDGLNDHWTGCAGAYCPSCREGEGF